MILQKLYKLIWEHIIVQIINQVRQAKSMKFHKKNVIQFFIHITEFHVQL